MFATKKWRGAFSVFEADRKKAAKGKLTPDELARDNYHAGLASSAPPFPTSDHIAESRRLRGAVYVAAKVLGDQAAAAEVKLYEWHPDARMAGDQDAKEPVQRSHPLATLLTRPNRRESGGMLRRQRVQQLILTGISLVWRWDDGLNTPAEQWSIPSGSYQPVPISASYPDGAYRIMPWAPAPMYQVPGGLSAGGVTIPSEQMIACKIPHPLVPNGELSPLTACDLEMDTADSINRARYSKARQGISPSAKVTLDPAVAWPTDPQLVRIKREIQQAIGGPDKAGSLAVLGPGMDLEAWSDGAIELGYTESWSQLVGFVMAVVGIAKGMAFLDEGDASYAKLYAMLKQFNLFSMCPLLSMLADADNAQLVWPFFGEDMCVEYEPHKVDDDTILEARNNTLISCGAITVNEVRQSYNLPKIEEEWGEARAGAGYKDPGQIEAETKAKAAAAPSGGMGAGGANAGKPTDPAEAARPKNDQGEGSLPPLVSGANLRGFAAPNPSRNGKRYSFNGNGRHE